MLEAKIWDRESSINGVAASVVIENLPAFVGADQTIFLVYDSAVPAQILRVEYMNVIRGNGGYGDEVSDSDVIEAYLTAANTPAEPVEKAVATDNELAIMDALATIYEQNVEILNQ